MDNSGHAFPLADKDNFYWEGLTKREWFAGMALQGMAATFIGGDSAEHFAALCYQLADAMIEEGKND